MPQYKLQIYIEFEADDEEKAMDTTVSILTQPPHKFKEFKEFDFNVDVIQKNVLIFDANNVLSKQQLLQTSKIRVAWVWICALRDRRCRRLVYRESPSNSNVFVCVLSSKVLQV